MPDSRGTTWTLSNSMGQVLAFTTVASLLLAVHVAIACHSAFTSPRSAAPLQANGSALVSVKEYMALLSCMHGEAGDRILWKSNQHAKIGISEQKSAEISPASHADAQCHQPRSSIVGKDLALKVEVARQADLGTWNLVGKHSSEKWLNLVFFMVFACVLFRLIA